MRRVLFDTNVLLDVLLEREPHFAASVSALDLVGSGRIEGLVSAQAVVALAPLLARRVGRERSLELVSILLSKVRVAAITEAAVRRALASRTVEFEDAVCDAAASEAGVDVIVTRNLAGFARGTTLAVLPEALHVD